MNKLKKSHTSGKMVENLFQFDPILLLCREKMRRKVLHFSTCTKGIVFFLKDIHSALFLFLSSLKQMSSYINFREFTVRKA